MSCFFSIIIPTLNEDKYLPILLDNLLQQEETDFEVIVVDGRSEDRTVEISKKLQDPFSLRRIPLQVVISNKRSAAYQRNLGASQASGKYLVFFDADIHLPNNYLSSLRESLTGTNKVIPLATTWIKPDENKPMAIVVTGLAILMMEIGRLIGKQLAYGFNTIVERNIFFNIGGFDSKVNVTDDYDFSLRAYRKGYHLTIFKNPKVCFSMRRFHAQGWTKTLVEYAKMVVYNFFKGPPKEKVFIYPMGGKAHE